MLLEVNLKAILASKLRKFCDFFRFLYKIWRPKWPSIGVFGGPNPVVLKKFGGHKGKKIFSPQMTPLGLSPPNLQKSKWGGGKSCPPPEPIYARSDLPFLQGSRSKFGGILEPIYVLDHLFLTLPNFTKWLCNLLFAMLSKY